MSKRFPQPDLSQISQIDWARLAAYIDGEGCISIKAVKGYNAAARRVFYIDVTVANTDFRLTAWLQRTFGGSSRASKPGSRPKGHAPVAQWNVASRHAANLIQYCLPYFIIKREQADVALAFQETILPGKPYGCKGRPQELIDRQDAFKRQLIALKGTSGGRRPRRNSLVGAPTIQ